MNRIGYSASVAIAAADISRDNATIHGMQAQLSSYQVRRNVPIFWLHGIVSRPLPGAQMAVLLANGDPNQALCVGTNDGRYHLQGLPDGTVGLAHHLGAHVLFFDDHIAIEAAGKPVVITSNGGPATVQAPAGLIVDGDLTVTGNLIWNADTTPTNAAGHRHTGVQTGSATSGPPVPG